MCGRYTLTSDGEALVEAFGLNELARWSPRYNIAPSQPVPALLWKDGSREVAALHWGLVPAWARDRKMSSRLINARAETVAEKSSFRAALRKRRCLVLADGYYEWAKQGNTKQPYYICYESRRPFAFAGLWESWTQENGSAHFSCSIITCAANPELAQLHHRMPVILANSDHETWLNDGSDATALTGLLKPATSGTFTMFAVSTFVNSPAHEGPDCIKPMQP